MSGFPSAEAPPGDIAPEAYLIRLGQAGDGPHDIAFAALILSALDHPERKLAPYAEHLAEVAAAARAEAEFAGTAERGAEMLASLVCGRYGYDGDRRGQESPGNADLMEVIERRRGLPVALGILYIHAARGAGFEASGLFAPGHFMLRIGVKGSQAVIDPFNGGAALDAEKMSSPRMGMPLFVEQPLAGEPNPADPVSDIDVLLRLLNNIKGRALKARDMARSFEIVRRMTLIAPGRPAIWLDLGRLHEINGALSAARASFERCLTLTPPDDALRNETALALHALKRRLN